MKFLPLVCEEFIDMYFMVVWTKGNHWKRRKNFPVKFKIKLLARLRYIQIITIEKHNIMYVSRIRKLAMLCS